MLPAVFIGELFPTAGFIKVGIYSEKKEKYTDFHS